MGLIDIAQIQTSQVDLIVLGDSRTAVLGRASLASVAADWIT